ncbi:MAG TPA: ACT domain-containing protein [Terriglobales bacterium]|nr:ACT domain-containing protein [Terriglobales bacterium]
MSDNQSIGETNLAALLRGMRPVLRDGIYVFVTLPPGSDRLRIEPLMSFREAEGLTMIVTEEEAEAFGLDPVFRSRMITLDVHSSLEAVGFLAVITSHLAAAGMGCNPVSAFYHDHLFVPVDRAEEALEILEALAAKA